MKYVLELIYKSEFEDSPIGRFNVEKFDYNLGEATCRWVLAAMFVGCRLLGFILYRNNARSIV
jgi:hypothetical protein